MEVMVVVAMVVLTVGGLGLGAWLAMRGSARHEQTLRDLARDSDARLHELGLRGEFDGQPYALTFPRVDSGGSSYSGALLSLPAGVDNDIQVRAMNAFEHGSHVLGLARLVSTGDDAFDARYSLQAGAPALAHALFAHRPVRDSIDRLFELGAERLDCDVEAQAVLVRWRSESTFLVHAPRDLRKLVVLARPLLVALPPMRAAPQAPARRAGHVYRRFALGALALLGCGCVLGLLAPLLWRPLVVADIFPLVLPPAGFGFALYATLAWRALGRRVEGHEHWPATAIIGLAGFVVAPVPLGLALNALLDSAPPRVTLARVQAQVSQRIDGVDRCVLELDKDWGGPGDLRALAADWSLCRRLTVGDTLVIRVRPGRFGVRWQQPRHDIARVDAASAMRVNEARD